MAQTAQINIKVDSSQGQQSVDGLNSSIKTTEQSTGTLKAQLKALTLELQGLEPGSERFTELTLKAGQLKDTISDTNSVINATATSAVGNLGAGLTSVAKIGVNAFQGLAGAQAVFGSKSEALQETMVKLQGLMAMSSAIASLGELGDDITKLKTNFMAFGKSAVAALQGVKGAVAGTGIGLLVIAVGLLVAYWDDIKAAMSGISVEQENLNKQAAANLSLQEKKFKELKGQDNILRLQGLTEKEILQKKIIAGKENMTALKISIKNAKITLQSQIETEQRNKDILKGFIMLSMAPLLVITKAIDWISEGLALLGITSGALNLTDSITDTLASFVFDPNAVKTEGLKVIEEQEQTLKALDNEVAGYQLAINKIEADAIAERKNLAKGETENKQKTAEAQQKIAEENLRKLKDSELALMEEGRAKELEANRVSFERQIEDLKKNKKTLSDVELKIIDNLNAEKIQKDKEINATFDKQADEELKKKQDKEKQDIEDAKKLREEVFQDEKKVRDLKISQMESGEAKEKAIRQAAYTERLHDLDKLLEEEKISREDYQSIVLLEEKIFNADMAKIEEDAAAKRLEEQNKKYEELAKNITLYGDAVLNLANSLNALFEEVGKKRLEKINEAAEVESLSLKSQLENRIISQAEFDAITQQNQQKLEEETKKIQRKAFNREKGINIASGIQAGALAVLQALASSPPPANFILAGIAGVASAAQIGVIASQQFKAARGGIVPGNGMPGDIDSVSSMLAPGEAVINARSTSMFPQALDMINRAGGGQSLLPQLGSGTSNGQGVVFGDNNNQNQTIRAYVVESEITSSQKRINRIENSVQF
jgi:hypothetical protein